jgi:hypothetical protein
MADDRPFYLPWYEASPVGLDELTQIKRVVDELAAHRDGVRHAGTDAVS